MTWTWQDFYTRLGVATVLTPVVRYVPLLWGADALWWWLAAVIALALVFAGELLIDAFTGDA